MGAVMARFVKQWYARRRAGPQVQEMQETLDENLYYEFEYVIEVPQAGSEPPSIPEGNDDGS